MVGITIHTEAYAALRGTEGLATWRFYCFKRELLGARGASRAALPCGKGVHVARLAPAEAGRPESSRERMWHGSCGSANAGCVAQIPVLATVAPTYLGLLSDPWACILPGLPRQRYQALSKISGRRCQIARRLDVGRYVITLANYLSLDRSITGDLVDVRTQSVSS
jgi:hypothetical protein